MVPFGDSQKGESVQLFSKPSWLLNILLQYDLKIHRLVNFELLSIDFRAKFDRRFFRITIKEEFDFAAIIAANP